ncbi:MAG: phytoene desaturase family protein, partial [Candidatus Helarchaeales archaeon]
RGQVWEKDGYLVDFGLHSFRRGRQGWAAKIAKKLGLKLKFRSPGAVKFLDKDGFHAFPNGLVGAIKTKLLTTREKLKFIYQFIFKDLRRLDFKSEEIYRKSVKEYLDEINATENMRRLFRMVSMSAIISEDLERTSMGELFSVVKSLLKARHNVESLEGTWKTLIDALRNVIEQNGGHIYLGEKVEKIKINENLAAGVVTNKAEYDAPVIVCAFPAQNLFNILDETKCPPDYVKRCKSLIPTAGITFDFGLKMKISDMKGVFLTLEPSGMGHFTSNIDPTVVPEGKQLLAYLMLISPEEAKNKQKALELKEFGRKKLFEYFPELEPSIEWERTMILEMVDGVELLVDQTIYDRPGLEVPSISNLYLIGDTTNMPSCTSGDIAFASALECFKLIEQKMKNTS